MDAQQLEYYVKQAKQGDHEAFAQIYQATYSKASYIVKSILRGYTDEDWKDTLQSAYMAMLINLDKYEEGNSFRAWFLKIVKNTAIDYDKKHGRKYLQEMDMIIEAIADSDNTPEKFYGKKEVRELVENSVNLLSPQQKEAITLFYFEDLPIKEIANRMGINENTVKTHLKRGREQLEVKLLGKYPKNDFFNGVVIMPLLVSMFEKDIETGLAVLPANIIEAVTATAATSAGTAGTATATTVGTAATATTTATAASHTGIGALIMGLGAGAKAGIAIAAAVVIVGGVSIPVYIHNENQKAVQAMAVIQQKEEEAEQSRIEAETKAASEKAVSEKAASEKAASEKAETEKAEAERKAAEEKAEQERIEVERIEAEKAASEAEAAQQEKAKQAAIDAQEKAVADQKAKEAAAVSSSAADGNPPPPPVSNPASSAQESKPASSSSATSSGKPATKNGYELAPNGKYYVQPGGPFNQPSSKEFEKSSTNPNGETWFTSTQGWMSDIGAWRGTDLNGTDVLCFPGGGCVKWSDYIARYGA